MAKRRDLLKLPAALAPLALMGAKPGGLQNIVVPAGAAKVTKETFGELKIFFDGPTDQLASMTAGSLLLYAGQEPHPPHKHPEEEFLLVTEGTGEITVGGKTTKVAPGAMMYCAGNALHHIRNTGKTGLLFYFYKWSK